MVLCDIGNSFLHFYHRGRIWKEKVCGMSAVNAKKLDGPVYYISVNEEAERKFVRFHDGCINLEPFINIYTPYIGLGIDRKAACKAISNGVIVDAGSAITVDIVQDGLHLGGYIMPGIAKYAGFFKEISPSLDKEINFAVNLSNPPQCTRDAVSFGVLKSIVLVIKHTSSTKRIYFTGGDGKYLSRFFDNSIFDNTLVFKGMLKAVEEIQHKEA